MRFRQPSGGRARSARSSAAGHLRSSALVSAAAVVALLVAGCGSAAPATRAPQPEAVGDELTVAAQAPASVWQVAWVSPSVQLTGIHVFGPENVWVAGSDGRIYAWDGTGWHVQRLDEDLGAMAAVSPRDVWVSSDDGIRHWNGSGWSLTSHDGAVTALAALDAHHVWATDQIGIRTWNGTTWVRQYVAAGADLTGIATADATHAWAVGSLPDGSGVIVAWDGSAWTVQATVPQPLSAVYAAGPASAWAIGPEGAVYTWDGSTWQQTADLHLPLTGIAGSGPGHVWAVSQSGEVLSLEGSTWTVVYRAPTTLSAISALDGSTVWAIGFDTIYSTVAPSSTPAQWNTAGL